MRELLLRWRRHRAYSNTREIFISLQEIIARALNDLEQTIHRRYFLELLSQEPLQEINCNVVVRVSREFDQTIDLIMVAQALHWFDLDGFYAECDTC